MKQSKSGFTLIELLVVIAIIAILTAFITVSVTQTRAQSRDVERQGNLRIVQTALEQYKTKYGRYPEGCNGASNSGPVWSGHSGGSYACAGGAQYITGLAPEFIPALPIDSQAGNDGNQGYVYAVNANGTVYKFAALGGVESSEVATDHLFYWCDSFCDSCSAPSISNKTFAISDGISTINQSSDTVIKNDTSALRCQ